MKSQSMKKQVFCTLFALGTAAGVGVGYAQNRDRDDDGGAAKIGEAPERRERDNDRPDRGGRQRQADRKATGVPAMDKALNRMYRRGEFEVGQTREINGVTVADVTVQTRDGDEALARVTEYGDFLVSGAPADKSDLPQAVRQTTQSVFKGGADANALVATYYYINIDAGNAVYQLKADAAGRLLDLRTEQQLERRAGQERTPAAEDQQQRLTRIVSEEVEGAEIGDMFEWDEAPGFHLVQYTLDGKPGFVIVDASDNVFSRRTTIEWDDLPTPVMRAVEALFNVESVRAVQKSEQTYYQFEKQVGDELMTMRLHPSGDVMSIVTDKPVKDDEREVVQKEKTRKQKRRGGKGGGVDRQERDRPARERNREGDEDNARRRRDDRRADIR